MIVIQTAQLLKHSPASVCLDNDFPVYYTRKSLIQFSVCCALNGKYLYTQIVYMCMSNFQLSEYPLIIVTSHYFSFSFPPSLPFPFPSSPTPTPTLPLSPPLSPQVTYTVCMLVKVTCTHVQYDLKLSHPLTNTNSIHVLCGFVKVSHHTWRVHVYTNHKLIITWFTCKDVVCAYIVHVFMEQFSVASQLALALMNVICYQLEFGKTLPMLPLNGPVFLS